jgi:hypothetical protein
MHVYLLYASTFLLNTNQTICFTCKKCKIKKKRDLKVCDDDVLI